MILARAMQNQLTYRNGTPIEGKELTAMWHIQEQADATTSTMICGNMLPTDITEAILLEGAKIGTRASLCGYCLQQLDYFILPEVRHAKLMGR